MLGGGFNVADIVLESSRQDSPMQPLADNLLSTMDDDDLVNLQHEATCCDNLLELFCTIKPGHVNSVGTIPGFSDHSFILVGRVLKRVTKKKNSRKIYKRDKADWESVNNSVDEACSSFR